MTREVMIFRVDNAPYPKDVKISREALEKFIVEVCEPIRNDYNKTGFRPQWFSQSFRAKDYQGYVYDLEAEYYADYTLFTVYDDGLFCVHYSLPDCFEIYEVMIPWERGVNGNLIIGDEND